MKNFLKVACVPVFFYLFFVFSYFLNDNPDESFFDHFMSVNVLGMFVFVILIVAYMARGDGS